MSTTAPGLGHALDLSSTRPTPFHRLVRVELRKSYDTRAGFWLLAVIGFLVLLTEGIVLAVTVTQDEADDVRRLRRPPPRSSPRSCCRCSASCW